MSRREACVFGFQALQDLPSGRYIYKDYGSESLRQL